MQVLNFPAYNLRVRTVNDQQQVFDVLRKKWLVLQPEEWVRQHLVHFMIEEKGYPAGLISIEKELKLNGMSRRTDLVVYNKQAKPILIAECKAPNIPIDQSTLDQAGRYNLVLQVPFLLLTNGLQHFCFQFNEDNEVRGWKEFPRYEDVLGDD